MATDSTLLRLALLGTCTDDLLSDVMGEPLSLSTRSALQKHPAVTFSDGQWQIDDHPAASLLHALEQDNFLHFQQLHQKALAVVGERMKHQQPDTEAQFARLFRRLADTLLNQDTQHLLALLDSTHDLPLTPRNRHLYELYRGTALRIQERYTDAIAVLDELLAQPDLDRWVYGRALNSRALCFFWQGALQSALDGYHASLAIWRELDDPLQSGLVQLNIGIVDYELHRYAEAERSLRQAETNFRQSQARTWFATVQNELGLLYRDQGRWDEALIAFQACIDQRRYEGASDRVGVALNNVGEVLLLQGRFTEAEAALREALRLMSTQIVKIDALLNLGLITQVDGALEEARTLYAEALQIAQTIQQGNILPAIHYRLADVSWRLGDNATATEHIRQAVTLLEANRAPLRDEGLRISYLGRWQMIYELAVVLALEADLTSEALTLIERACARAFLDLLAAHENLSPFESSTAHTLEEPLSAGEIQHHLAGDVALVEFFASGQPGTQADLLAKLPAQAAQLRSHLLAPDRLVAIVVTKRSIAAVSLQTSVAQIQALHFNRSDGRLRGITPLVGQPLTPLTRWRDLGNQLLCPLASLLCGAHHLYFVPHSVLHYLPLHALTEISLLTEVATTTVSYAPSASILFKRRERLPKQPASVRALCVAVDGAGLQHAQAEAKWIARVLGAQTLLGDEATAQRVCAALPNHDVIHFSCHGLFRQRSPLDSALALYDGELTAARLLQEVRLDADLITLSACDTGLNRIAPGDELLGLTRAFLGSGARALLVTLWPVHELPTRLLMEHFYARRQAGATNAVALNVAQSHLRALNQVEIRAKFAEYGIANADSEALIQLFRSMKSSDHLFDHPYYWAAFLLIGDTRL